MRICDWVSDSAREAAKRFNLACAQRFGVYVEVDKPTLKYRAYLWRGNYYFVDKPIAVSVRPTPIVNLNVN